MTTTEAAPRGSHGKRRARTERPPGPSMLEELVRAQTARADAIASGLVARPAEPVGTNCERLRAHNRAMAEWYASGRVGPIPSWEPVQP
ncbi:hypothetical protein JOF53_000763 [Crossiella equi]|uniref:Uncharacterized protein n=1 Tax=Crossiella equi TaxID=130796 RepID=A0ABS5A6F1_9PSEU|nr:hypothetical protein [Crossiella equi]MBP2471891.1 hypothetical protein [Crossiella equi]